MPRNSVLNLRTTKRTKTLAEAATGACGQAKTSLGPGRWAAILEISHVKTLRSQKLQMLLTHRKLPQSKRFSF